MKSIMSFPERGKWGNNKYRGNTSGHVYRELIEQYIGNREGVFVDACMGGGTSRDVVADLFPNVEYHGLDLRDGFDFTSMSIRNHIKKEADIVTSHPPYDKMVSYSGSQWGDQIHPADTSHCNNTEEFLAKSQVMLLNQRQATKQGGVYATLIGDRRSRGEFRSYQADFINMMPTNELKSVVIKLQHNCMSDSRQYSNMKHPPILHEYLLIWEKSKATIVQVMWDKAAEMLAASKMTWRALIRMAIMSLGGKAQLSFIYDEVAKVAPEKMKSNPTWQATVRRTLQQHFENVERGVWALS